MRRSQLQYTGSSILNRTADPLISFAPMLQKGATWSFQCLRIKHRVLFEFSMSKFCGKNELNKEKTWTWWNPIFNCAVLHVNEADRNKGVEWYSTTNELLTGCTKQEKLMKFSTAWDAMHFYLHCLSESLQLQRGILKRRHIQTLKVPSC